METPSISKSELKELVKEAIISALTERGDLLQHAVSEAILDMKLGLAVEEGDTGEYCDEEQLTKVGLTARTPAAYPPGA